MAEFDSLCLEQLIIAHNALPTLTVEPGYIKAQIGRGHLLWKLVADHHVQIPFQRKMTIHPSIHPQTIHPPT